ncbi:hypothetical protein [Microbacterium rhizophilus]|uniref:hypothetical protein n=1 Tax=Microbacterium rhizophilus TaxID=3138934 RepID=UPI0031E70148
MSDSTAGIPESGANGKGLPEENDAAGPDGPHAAGDTLGGAETPTGNDGTMGADAPAGDASLADGDPDAAALPDGADAPSEVYGEDEVGT